MGRVTNGLEGVSLGACGLGWMLGRVDGLDVGWWTGGWWEVECWLFWVCLWSGVLESGWWRWYFGLLELIGFLALEVDGWRVELVELGRGRGVVVGSFFVALDGVWSGMNGWCGVWVGWLLGFVWSCGWRRGKWFLEVCGCGGVDGSLGLCGSWMVCGCLVWIGVDGWLVCGFCVGFWWEFGME
ncbi:uncharacterized protein LOC116110173 [Pistacia vera]|uniref:uncharacterized protein LOC116110173 n=1 Tax=Pistacia vera TaxID=55513 RepID=UPI001263CC32|nr:uncharacterized protein LOC116110173 [Pistacia vera]